jgi:hypothetical protein
VIAETSSDGHRDAHATERVLVELLQLERELAELEYVRRSDALERAGDAVRRLGEPGSADGILGRAAAELGAASQFDRVLISEVIAESLQPLALWAGPDEAAAARAPAELAEPLGLRSYVIAALTAQGETIGLLHADATFSGRELDALDVEVAAKFAEGLSGVLERGVLRHTLELHRAELQSAVQWMSGRLSRLADGGALESSRPGSEGGGGWSSR